MIEVLEEFRHLVFLHGAHQVTRHCHCGRDIYQNFERLIANELHSTGKLWRSFEFEATVPNNDNNGHPGNGKIEMMPEDFSIRFTRSG